jgi:hypothetical protein
MGTRVVRHYPLPHHSWRSTPEAANFGSASNPRYPNFTGDEADRLTHRGLRAFGA